MATGSFLVETVTYLGAAVVSVPIAKRLGLGSVLGYLAAGLVIGPSVLGLIDRVEDVRDVAEFGIVMMLFLVGLELQPQRLWAMRGAVFGFGSAQILVTALVGAAAAAALGLLPASAIAAGFVLAMSSTAIVLQALAEKGQLHSGVGETSFAILLLQDLAVIPILALLPLLSPTQGAEAAVTTGLITTLPGWVQAIAVPAAVVALVMGGRWLARPLFRLIARTRLREIFTASALLLVMAAALLMQTVGLSPALGAFLGGVVLADSEFRHELEGDIEPFKGLLLGLFFISVGANIDLPLLIAQPLLILGLVVAVVALKTAILFTVLRLFRLPPRDSLLTAVALSQVGEFAFLLVGFAAHTLVFTPETAALLNIIVALSMVTTPLLLIALDRLLLARAVPPLEREPDLIEDRHRIIIAGFGRVGQIIGRLLIGRGFHITVLEHDDEQLEAVMRFGWKTYYGDARREAILRAAGAEEASLLIVATDDKEGTLEIVETAKRNFPRLTVLARAYDRGHAYALEASGADRAVRETFAGSVEMACEALKALGFPAFEAERLGRLFRRHDLKGYEDLRAVNSNLETYALATRAHFDTLASVLLRDAQVRTPDDENAWDVDTLIDEIRTGDLAPAPDAASE